MSEMEDLRRRMDAVEGEVARLREGTANAQSLARMADRDVADIRGVIKGHTKVLNALRQTQIEHDQTLRGIATVVGGLVTGQATMGKRLDTMDERLGRVDERMDAMAARQIAFADQQTAMSKRQDTMAEKQDAMARRQDTMANQQSIMLSQQAVMAEHLQRIVRSLDGGKQSAAD